MLQFIQYLFNEKRPLGQLMLSQNSRFVQCTLRVYVRLKFVVVNRNRVGIGAANVFLCQIQWKSFQDNISIRCSSKVWRTASTSFPAGGNIAFPVPIIVSPSSFPSWRSRPIIVSLVSAFLPLLVLTRHITPAAYRSPRRYSCVILRYSISACFRR